MLGPEIRPQPNDLTTSYSLAPSCTFSASGLVNLEYFFPLQSSTVSTGRVKSAPFPPEKPIVS